MTEEENITVFKCEHCKKELTIPEIVWVKNVVYTFNLENRDLFIKETQKIRFEAMKEFARMEFVKLVRHEDWKKLEYAKDGTYFPTITYPVIGERIYCKTCSDKLTWSVVE